MNRITEMGRLSTDPHCFPPIISIILAEDEEAEDPAEVNKLLKASVVFLTRTLREPIRRKAAEAEPDAALLAIAAASFSEFVQINELACDLIKYEQTRIELVSKLANKQNRRTIHTVETNSLFYLLLDCVWL